MSAYVIVDIEVIDPEGYKEYAKIAPATVTLYGGRYLARGGKNETLEGDWHASEKAKAWLDSPEYAPARKLRHKYAKSNMVVIEGT
jgi:uncharacterized protein (DUF1330 family)